MSLVNRNYHIADISSRALITSYATLTLYFFRAPFRCKECPKTYMQQQSLDRHIRLIHRPCLLFACWRAGCVKTFKSKERLLTHVKNVHDQHEVNFKCPICGVWYKFKGSLAEHLKKHPKK